MTDKPFKPNLEWLQKVADGKVYVEYKFDCRTLRFIGSKVAFNRHHDAGYVTKPMRPANVISNGYVRLTEKGRDALKALKNDPKDVQNPAPEM